MTICEREAVVIIKVRCKNDNKEKKRETIGHNPKYLYTNTNNALSSSTAITSVSPYFSSQCLFVFSIPFQSMAVFLVKLSLLHYFT